MSSGGRGSCDKGCSQAAHGRQPCKPTGSGPLREPQQTAPEAPGGVLATPRRPPCLPIPKPGLQPLGRSTSCLLSVNSFPYCSKSASLFLVIGNPNTPFLPSSSKPVPKASLKSFPSTPGIYLSALLSSSRGDSRSHLYQGRELLARRLRPRSYLWPFRSW